MRPKRLSFYLLETTKFVFWVTFPATILMMFFAEKIFHTLFLSSKFSMAHVQEAQMILIACVVGLFFFSLNKILLNMYYALHVTWIPTVVSIMAICLNIVLNCVLMPYFKAVGLALATTISIGIVQTLLFIGCLKTRFDFRFYIKDFLKFFIHYAFQLMLLFAVFYALYCAAHTVIEALPENLAYFMLYSLGFWCWVGPLCGLLLLAIFYTRTFFKVRLYFLD